LLTFVTIPEMTLNDILSLNVGGRIFLTARSTLISEPDSMLANMFDPNAELEPSQMVDGAFFIDGDPDRFAVILNYLRDKTLDIPPNVTKKGVLLAASYFGLARLLTELQDQAEEGAALYELIRNSNVRNIENGGSTFVDCNTKERLLDFFAKFSSPVLYARNLTNVSDSKL